MNITLGNSVRLPLSREPRMEAAIPVEFTEMPALNLTFSPAGRGSAPGAGPDVALPPANAVAMAAFQEPFDQFDDLLTPLGSSALSDWPL